MQRPESLTELDHDELDKLLSHLLDEFQAGRLPKSKVVGGLTHLIAAIDGGNDSEKRTWLYGGRDSFKNAG